MTTILHKAAPGLASASSASSHGRRRCRALGHLSVCLLFCGCGPSVGHNRFSQEVLDDGRTNRLALLYVPTRRGCLQDQGYEFDALIWSTNYEGKWSDKIVIRRHAFEAQQPRWCQVRDIGMFDPRNGTAVIKVAEESAIDRTNAGIAYIDIIYSWREWDLLNNREIRTVRPCKDPFEKY